MRDAPDARLPDRGGDVLRHVLDASPKGAQRRLRVHEHLVLAARRRRDPRGDARAPPAPTRASTCARSSASARATSRRWRRSTASTSARSTEEDCERDRRRRAGRAARCSRTSSCATKRGDAGRWLSLLLYKDIDEPGLNTLDVYERRGGYEMLRKALDMEPDDVLHELLASGVRGRGGAGFAMGTKASFIPKGTMDKYVVCNADESEPGTFKDRELMQKNPHLLIEGIMHRRLRDRREQGVHLHPRRVLPPGRHPRGGAGRGQGGRLRRRAHPRHAHSIDLWVHRGAGAYICGEETALLDALEGKRGNPRLKPPFPAVQGLYQRPDADQQRRDADERPDHPADGRRGVREDRHRDLDRHEGRLGLRLRPAPGQLRDRARHPDARDHLRPRRRPARAAARSSSGSPAARARRCCPAPTSTSTCPTTSTRWPRPARCSARARSSSSTTRRRSSTSRSRRRSSTATSPAASARRAARARTGP